MSFDGPLDTAMVSKSLREGWPLTPEKRREAIAYLEIVVANPRTRRRELDLARRGLAAAEQSIRNQLPKATNQKTAP